MSARSDVLEMQSLCEQMAEQLRLPPNIKARTAPVRQLLGAERFTWNRVNEFLRARARRIDGWEKDHAREALAKLRRAEQRRRNAEHVVELRRTLAALRAAPDPEFREPDIARLERALSRVGALPRVVGNTEPE